MQTSISPNDILVRAQDTPNPFAIRFIVNHVIKERGKATFNDVSESQGLPLVESLLNVKGVTQVYLFENTLTVTHEGDLKDDDLKDVVVAVIKTRLPAHNPEFTVSGEELNSGPSERKVHDNSEANLIEEILDRTIRPGLQADGGDVEIISWENGELRILYQGACGGCPSAMMGTLDAIQNILRHEMENDELIVIPI